MALTDATTDAIGERCATLKVTGDNDPVETVICFAVRTSGPYLPGDGAIIRAGTGAVATLQLPNISRQYALVTGLASDVQHYWGAVKDSGNAVVADFTTQLANDPVAVTNPLPRPGVSL